MAIDALAQAGLGDALACQLGHWWQVKQLQLERRRMPGQGHHPAALTASDIEYQAMLPKVMGDQQLFDEEALRAGHQFGIARHLGGVGPRLAEVAQAQVVSGQRLAGGSLRQGRARCVLRGLRGLLLAAAGGVGPVGMHARQLRALQQAQGVAQIGVEQGVVLDHGAQAGVGGHRCAQRAQSVTGTAHFDQTQAQGRADQALQAVGWHGAHLLQFRQGSGPHQQGLEPTQAHTGQQHLAVHKASHQLEQLLGSPPHDQPTHGVEQGPAVQARAAQPLVQPVQPALAPAEFLRHGRAGARQTHARPGSTMPRSICSRACWGSSRSDSANTSFCIARRAGQAGTESMAACMSSRK